MRDNEPAAKRLKSEGESAQQNHNMNGIEKTCAAAAVSSIIDSVNVQVAIATAYESSVSSRSPQQQQQSSSGPPPSTSPPVAAAE